MESLLGKGGDGLAALFERCHLYNRGRDRMSARSRITGKGVAAGTLLLIVTGVGALVAVVFMLLL
ncbi:MAG: hypothetical protein KAJ73_04215 [Zetaproteobacteria bacterium]|nr:hypothetical protein [Zetaproteobacteria bacterium]